MKVIKIYEPSMCCSTGVCGPSVDTELLRITALMNQLNVKTKRVERYNLSDHPMAFVENNLVNQLLNEKGVEVLPITVFEGKVIKTGAYPSTKEIKDLLGVTVERKKFIKVETSSCCQEGCC